MFSPQQNSMPQASDGWLLSATTTSSLSTDVVQRMRTPTNYRAVRKIHHKIFPEILKAFSHSMSIQVEKCPLMESLVVSDSPPQNLADAHEVPDHLLQAHGLTYKD